MCLATVVPAIALVHRGPSYPDWPRKVQHLAQPKATTQILMHQLARNLPNQLSVFRQPRRLRHYLVQQ